MDFQLESYIRNHIDPEPENLRHLDRLTNIRLINGRMCSGHIQGRLLKMLVEMIRPKLAIELGTFSGYSALCIAEGMEEDARLHTFEIDDELEDFIRRQLDASDHGHKIELRIGSAIDICREFTDGSVDLIFIDADKRQYPQYLEECARMLRPGGIIIADNTLWSGHVCDPAYDKDPQTTGVRKFNDMAIRLPGFETVILPFRDGITLLRKTE